MQSILVIGAGPAGLTAAYKLLQAGDVRVTVLEESRTVGGISRTVNVDGDRMDLGGHRFFSKDEQVTALWRELLPCQGAASYDDAKLNRESRTEPGGPDPEKTDDVMLLRHRVSRIYYKGKFFDYPISMSVKTIRNMGLGDTMAAGFSYLGSMVRKKPETNLENFYINRFGKRLYSMFFEGYTEKLWGRHPSRIAADWGAQRVKGLSILAVLKNMLSPGKTKETSLIEEFMYPKHGPGQLWETMADRVRDMGGEILFGCRVTGVSEDCRTVRYTENGAEKTIECDKLVSSMPLAQLVCGMDGVPEDVRRIAAELPFRDFITVGLLVDRLALKNETNIPTLGNIVPDCWIYVQDTGVDLGRIQIFNNWSPYMLNDPDNTVWIGLEYFCREDDALWRMDEPAFVRKAVAELERIGVLSPGQTVRKSHLEHVRKAYPAYFDSYDQIDRVIEFLNTKDALFCVGRNGQHRYNNMDHSMATAFEAVRCILRGETDKTALWNVNTEQSYHEEKRDED